MEIDLFTFIAQLVNFIILVLLLNKFLFKRIKSAMDAREAAINQSLMLAEEKREEAYKMASQADEIRRDVAARTEEMLKEAREAAVETKDKLEKEALEETQAEKKTWQNDLLNIKERFLSELAQKSGELFCRLAEKAQNDLADEKLSWKITEVFISRLEKADLSGSGEYQKLMEKSGKEIKVKSSFEIPIELKKDIEKIIGKKFKYRGKVLFEIVSGDLCGVLLVLDGFRISWSIQDYLENLEKEIAEAFEIGKEG
jgi:F-type H+-transporting ATPase subunit b